MMFHTKEPETILSKVKTSYGSDNIIRVTISDGPAYISFYNQKTGESQCFYGESAEFYCDDIDDITMYDRVYTNKIEQQCLYVYGPNKKPGFFSFYDIKTNNFITPIEVSKIENLQILDFNLVIKYRMEDHVVDAFILVVNTSTGAKVITQKIDPKAEETTVDISSLPSGIYTVSIIADNELVDSQTIRL